jgi:alkylation response protein AidB-like acyl-CoA dehydrogenase
MVSMAKRNNVDAALQVDRLARNLLGANSTVDDYQSMRHMMNLETGAPTRGPTTCTR